MRPCDLGTKGVQPKEHTVSATRALLPCLDGWPDRPVLLLPSPAAPDQVFHGSSAADPLRRLRCNHTPLHFESDLFVGRLYIYFHGLPTTPTNIFIDKKRRSWICCQGRFKRPVTLADLLTGQEFGRPLLRLPAAWFLENVLLCLARKISPSMTVGPLSEPSMLIPLVAAAQLVNVSEPGSEPDVLSAPEDMRLFDPRLVDKKGAPLCAAKRRRYFLQTSNRAGRVFSTDHVWTFQLWQHYLDLPSYTLEFGLSSYNLARHLDGQPLQLMAKDRASGGYLYNLHVWHEKLVQPGTAPHACEGAELDAEVFVES